MYDFMNMVCNPVTIDKVTYFKDEKDNVYLAKSTGNYAFEIVNLNNGNKINKPTVKQKMYAFVNFLSEDNCKSESKQGLFNMKYDELFKNAIETMQSMKVGKIKDEESVLNLWAVVGGELKQGTIRELSKELINDLGKNREEEKSL